MTTTTMITTMTMTSDPESRNHRARALSPFGGGDLAQRKSGALQQGSAFLNVST
jgi:hypothetical protein